MKRKCKQGHFPESKLSGPHLSYFRKLRRSRVSVPKCTQTQSFNLRHGAALGAASPARPAGSTPGQLAAPRTSCQTALTDYSVPIGCLQVKESPKFCSEVHSFIFCSSLSTNCVFIALHWVKGYCCLSCWRWISKDSAAAGHPTSLLNPARSQMLPWTLTAPKAHN